MKRMKDRITLKRMKDRITLKRMKDRIIKEDKINLDAKEVKKLGLSF